MSSRSSLLLGYTDRTGELVVPASLRAADTFVGRIAFAARYGERRFGFLHREGRWAVEPRFDGFGHWSTGPDHIGTVNVGGERGDRAVRGGRWGLVGGDGLLVEPRWEEVGTPAEGVVPFRAGDRWGLASRTGEVVIEPRFEWLGAVGDGVAIAAEGGRDGFLRLDGSWLLSPAYEQSMPFSGGRGRVLRDGAWWLVDRDGATVSAAFDEIWPFVAGLARVKRGDRFSVIGLDGELVVDRWFDEVGGYADGLAPVRDGDDWYHLAADGRLFGPFVDALPCTEGLARFVRDGGVGFLRPDGAEVVAPIYQSAGGFSGGRAEVKRDDRWTFIDVHGREIAPPTWDDARGFPRDGSGPAPVRRDGRWGAVDLDGAEVIPPRFDTLGRFSAGLAPARRVEWLAEVAAPRPDWMVMPAGGLRHAAFAGLGAEAELRVTMCFGPTLDPDQLERVHNVYWGWKQVLDAEVGGEALNSTWISTYAVSARIAGHPDPVRVAAILLDAFAEMELPIREVTVAPFRPDPEEPPQWQLLYPTVPAVPHPEDPRGPVSFPDFDTYWDAVWDEAGVPPRSENPFYLRAGRWDQQAGRTRLDERLLSLHVPGLRVAYGVFQGGFTDRVTERSEVVATAVEDALQARFERVWVHPGDKGWVPPVPMARDWSVGVEQIAYRGRIGWYFAVDCPPLLQDVGPDVFRYREPELMEAMEDVVGRLDLAPVVLWQRFGDPLPGAAMAGTPHPLAPKFYLIELWER